MLWRKAGMTSWVYPQKFVSWKSMKSLDFNSEVRTCGCFACGMPAIVPVCPAFAYLRLLVCAASTYLPAFVCASVCLACPAFALPASASASASLPASAPAVGRRQTTPDWQNAGALGNFWAIAIAPVWDTHSHTEDVRVRKILHGGECR